MVTYKLLGKADNGETVWIKTLVESRRLGDYLRRGFATPQVKRIEVIEE